MVNHTEYYDSCVAWWVVWSDSDLQLFNVMEDMDLREGWAKTFTTEECYSFLLLVSSKVVEKIETHQSANFWCNCHNSAPIRWKCNSQLIHFVRERGDIWQNEGWKVKPELDHLFYGKQTRGWVLEVPENADTGFIVMNDRGTFQFFVICMKQVQRLK